jgi:hypothetical protein
MPLTKGLLDVLISHPCSHCGHKHEKEGRWFQTIGHYRCPSCGHSVRITYDDKVRLFDTNAHRAIVEPHPTSRSPVWGKRAGSGAVPRK